MESRGNTKILERFAVARLQYTVNELQTKVDYDRSLLPPVHRVFHCIADDSALTTSIADFKTWIGQGFVSMIVPLCALDALDQLKKGTDTKNVNSRETIRYFERCQWKPARGVRFQAPKEMFPTWADCEQFRQPDAQVQSSGLQSVAGNGNGHWRKSRAEASDPATPPRSIQPILNCALFNIRGGDRKPALAGTEEQSIVLVSNNDDVRGWARAFGIEAISTSTLSQMIEDERWSFCNKLGQYEASVTPTSPTGRGRGGGRSGSSSRGGRGGGRGGRRNSRGGGPSPPPADPEFSRGNHASPPEYVLRGAPRGVPRGRGTLWEPN